MDYNGQSQYPPYHLNGSAYSQQFPQYATSQFQQFPSSQDPPQPRIEVVIPTRDPHLQYQPSARSSQPQHQPVSPQHHYQPPPPQQYYQPQFTQEQYYHRPPQYHQPPPQPLYGHDQPLVPLGSFPYYPPEQQSQMNGYMRLQQSPSSPDPLQNGYSQPQSRQSIQQAPPQPVAEPEPEPEPDYAVLLLSLAEEYFGAAKKLKSRSEEYYQLIATALGCLESVLTNFNLDPLREAQISLQYAQTLFDETENHDDAERFLTKAIDICERNKYLDLKYSLQLLLTCVLFQSKPKAAIKDLQTLIEDAMDYKHVAWVYALRYQLVTFYLSSSTVRDPQQAIQQLEKLGEIAGRSGDKAVVAFATMIEAILHLQTSNQDAVISAQRALATARSALLDSVASNIPQLLFMAEVVDLCCSIRESNLEQGDEKRKRLHKLFGLLLDDKTWKDGGSLISLPLSRTSLRGLTLQKGGLVHESKGGPVLHFLWLDLDEAEVAGFLLSAVSRARKNASDRDKVQQFIDEGLKGTRELLRIGAGVTTAENFERIYRNRLLECYCLVEQAFLQCSPGNWEAGRMTLQEINKSMTAFGDSPPKSLTCIVQYLQGVIEQGTGNLDAALTIYQSPDLSITRFHRATSTNGATVQHISSRSEPDFETRRNISILTAMNTLLIINDPSHPAQNIRADLLDNLSTSIKSCTDKNVLAAYTLVHQHVTERGMVVSKNQLVSALNAAKAVANTQITALVLMVMQKNFFRGQTDEHANKCVRAAAVNVRQWGDPTWGYVASGVERESLEFRGEREEVVRMGEEMNRRLNGVPQRVREKMRLDRAV